MLQRVSANKSAFRTIHGEYMLGWTHPSSDSAAQWTARLDSTDDSNESQHCAGDTYRDAH